MLSSWPELVGSMLAQTPLASRSVVAINALTGGVSSDIVEIILDDGKRLCAKRALPKLKVASVWEAPVERNQYEVAWLRHVATISPASVPKVLVEDRDNRAVLMEFLPAEDYVLWKAELLAGRYDTGSPCGRRRRSGAGARGRRGAMLQSNGSFPLEPCSMPCGSIPTCARLPCDGPRSRRRSRRRSPRRRLPGWRSSTATSVLRTSSSAAPMVTRCCSMPSAPGSAIQLSTRRSA